MLEKQLTQLGFSKNEITVYVSLFDLGKVRAGALIEKTGLHRNLIYTALEELVGRGLVTKTTSKGVAEFVANNPTRLVEEQEERKQLAQVIAEKLLEKQEEEPTEVAVYEGAEELKRLRKKSLMVLPGETTYVLGGSSLSSMPSLESFWKWYDTAMDKKGLQLKLLFDRTTDKTVLDRRNSYTSHEAKYLPFGIETPLLMCFFQDHIDFTLLNQKKPLIFSLKSKSVVDGFKKYFEYFWNQDVVVEKGMPALERAIYTMLDELEPGESYDVLGASVGQAGDMGQKLYDKFHVSRIQKGVITNMLVYADSYDDICDRFSRSGDEKEKISHVKKFISAPPIPMQINLYHNKAFFIFYGDEPTVVHFDKPEVYTAFKSYFDYLWSQENITYVGQSNVEIAYSALADRVSRGDEIIIFAAKPMTKRAVNFNIEIAKKLRTKVNRFRLLYYQPNSTNIKRAKEFSDLGCETKIIPTEQTLPISTIVGGDTVLNVVWSEQDEKSVCFELRNSTVADSVRDNFDLLWQQESRVLTGSNGIEILCELVLAEGEALYLVGATGSIMQTHGKYYAEFTKRRIRKEIPIYMLANSSVRKTLFTKLPLSTVHFLPKEFTSPMVIWIFGEYVATVLWHDPEQIFLTHNAEMANHYRQYYKGLLQISKR